MSKRTQLYNEHVRLNAKIIDFGGFDMPVQYSGIKDEHTAVRDKAGLFDVSHMGEFFVSGPQAAKLLDKVTLANVSKLEPGRAKYTAMCYEDGGIVDDLLVYMLAENEYMLVVNASNIEKDYDWIASQNSMGATLENRSDQYALLAIQGPEAIAIVKELTDTDVESIRFYTFEKGEVAGEKDVIISATGYTGEQGFELYIDTNKSDAVKIWRELLRVGEGRGILPAGLGARDTLRLEMGYPLYGNDITKDTTPVEARMSWLIDFDKDDFIGKNILWKQKEKGVSRKLMGFKVDEQRRIPRSGYTISSKAGDEIGFVTSGTQSITLSIGIGMGYISTENASVNEEIYINIRNKPVKAIVARPPFIKK
ncbi:MAG TPA: glycine cleavage system aminomethyltransferase GcvT [Balneolaceae bacterium]|nr:glycine cleavage system aminomethyltransferase GcvT [Balneolaceae bacterium]